MKNAFKLPLVFTLSLVLCVASLIFAAVSHRALVGDGSVWFFLVINNGEFYYDVAYCRYLDLLLQIPAVLVVNFFAGDVTSLALACIDFAYGLHPIISLIATAIILKKKNKMSFFVFPALSLATATMSTIAFAAGEAANALSVFWPLLAVLLFSEKLSLKEQVAMLLLTVGLIFSYEPAIILLGLLLLVSFLNFQGWRWPLLFSSGICWLVYRLFSPSTGHLRGNFFVSLYGRIDTFRIFTFAVCAVFLLALLIRKYRWGWMVVWGLLGTCTFVFLYYTYGKVHDDAYFVGPTTAFSSRITAIPVGFAIGFLMVAVNWWLKEKELFFSRNFFYFVGIVTLVATYVDFDRTVRWNKARYYLTDYIAQNPGCSLIPRLEYEDHFVPASLSDYGVAHASVLFLEQREVMALVFVDNNRPSSVDPCKGHKNDAFMSAQDSEVYTKGYFDFSKILSGL